MLKRINLKKSTSYSYKSFVAQEITFYHRIFPKLRMLEKIILYIAFTFRNIMLPQCTINEQRISNSRHKRMSRKSFFILWLWSVCVSSIIRAFCHAFSQMTTDYHKATKNVALIENRFKPRKWLNSLKALKGIPNLKRIANKVHFVFVKCSSPPFFLIRFNSLSWS